MKPKVGTGAASQHGTNKQFGKGPGVTNVPLKKSTANPQPPMLAEAKPRGKSVPMAPKINAGTGGSPDGAKRIINTEAHPAGRNSSSSTFRAPRVEGSGSDLERGYTKPGKM